MTPIDQDLLGRAAALAASCAADADGAVTAPLVEQFAALGVLDVDLRRDDDTGSDDIGGCAALLEAVAAECLSSAFSLWAHRMALEYVRAAESPGLAPLVDDLAAGRRAGSIAMATALQELSGLGSVPTLAVPDGAGGYRVHGRISWASNILPGTVVVFPARVVAPQDPPDPGSALAEGDTGTDTDTGERVVLAALVGDPGLRPRFVEDLLALGATRSAMLEFDDVHVPGERIVARSLDAARAQRSTHLILQTALCLGLARRCLEEAGAVLEGPGRVLAAHHDRMVAQHERLAAELAEFASACSRPGAREVTLLRYESARLAHAAARHESALTGGRGYVTTTATNRRLREATFLPVQSPSEVHLLHDLERFGVHVAANYQI